MHAQFSAAVSCLELMRNARVRVLLRKGGRSKAATCVQPLATCDEVHPRRGPLSQKGSLHGHSCGLVAPRKAEVRGICCRDCELSVECPSCRLNCHPSKRRCVHVTNCRRCKGISNDTYSIAAMACVRPPPHQPHASTLGMVGGGDGAVRHQRYLCPPPFLLSRGRRLTGTAPQRQPGRRYCRRCRRDCGSGNTAKITGGG